MPVHGRIAVDSDVMLGKPVIRGTRITVELVLRKLGEGATVAELLVAYPHLTAADIQAAMTYAADTLAHEDTVLMEPKAWMRRFLADESCDFRVVRALRAVGHDAMADVMPGAKDSAVIELAMSEDRIFITEDRDFGQLVYASATLARAVILIRFPSLARAMLPATLVEFVEQHGDRLSGKFVVIQPGRIRFGTIPKD